MLCAVPDSGPCVGRQYQFSAVLQGTLQFKLERRVKLQGRAKELQELYVKPRAKEVKVQANEVCVCVCVCVCVMCESYPSVTPSGVFSLQVNGSCVCERAGAPLLRVALRAQR